jgi:CMP-N-acetylneuraminic acid synthetase
MPRERSLDINDETDWMFAQFLLAQQDSLPSHSA